MVAELICLQAVDDPELPHVTIGDLGMVRSSRSTEIRPRPADADLHGLSGDGTDPVRCEAAVLAAGYEPSVEFVMSPPWSTDDITDQGRAKLTAGIAPPGAAADGPVALDLPVAFPPLQLPSHPSHIGLRSHGMQALHMCDACRQPFESFKAI